MSKIEEHYNNLLEAIEFERLEEEKYYLNMSANKTIKERQESGVLWYPVVLVKHFYTVGEYIELQFEKTRSTNSPHRLKVGMGCRIFKDLGHTIEFNFKGTISYLRRDKISVILKDNSITKDQLHQMTGNLCIELIHDERPYRVMKSAIEKLLSTDNIILKELRDAIATNGSLDDSYQNKFEYAFPHLNASQHMAMSSSLNASRMSIIHGPPGTGKTTTLVALIKILTNTEKKILVCAPSNNAVDLLATQLDKAGIKVTRIGNVSRISDNVSHLTLAERARNDDDWQHIKRVKIEAEEAKNQASKYKRNFGPQERFNRNALYKEAKELKHWAKDLEHKLLDRLINDSQVICSTLIGASDRSIKDFTFKTCIIDEASQALEPECWNAIIKSERVILAGDHLQLAPTVKSTEAIKLGFSETILHRMTDVIKHSYLLDTQYRMNDKILSFSNVQFYKGLLKSNDVNAHWLLPEDVDPLVFIDTSGCGFDEQYNPKSHSRYNEGEYFILREHFLQKKASYQGQSIGIISPYAEQVRFIRRKVEEDELYSGLDISVNSVDGFQGQERDVIYISLVRSNAAGDIGFLKDERRLNVAMTRAKKKLVLLGDLGTLSQVKLFDTLADHIEKEGTYRSAWEYMNI